MLRELNSRFLFAAVEISTSSVVPSIFSLSSDSRNSFVFGSLTSNDFTTINLPSANFDARPDGSAPGGFFWEKANPWVRVGGQCTAPPRPQSGERTEPIRARPVPFCFHSFLPEPETRQRFFVACVPARAEAR